MPLADAPISVLVVDDEEPIRNALKKFLTQQGYDVVTAASGEDALRVMQRQKVSVILLDVRMPGQSGIELVPHLLEAEPAAAILMLTAVNDATTAALCMQRGALDYLTKPIDLSDLARAILRAIRRRDSMVEQANLNQWLKEEVAVRTAELRRERAKLERLSVATLEALVNATEAKDPFIRGHSTRVADLGALIAAELGRSEEQVEQVRMAGRLHDIGKIGIREEILGKEGPLTTEEYEQVKQHVVIGSQILAPLVHLGEVIAYVRNHHERWDGQGYPDQLRGASIPFGARILAAAEIYDALTTSRPYQEKMPPEVAIERMRDLTGTVLDPEVYRALEAAVRRRQALVFLDDVRT
ncbi:MAG TPA: HD domain-containing phosphohydrolase [Candidatus Polarisedimenticolia bacterium]|nr:HD domain-containing phosphohydrolase [Candidatus Polarisedimenticolia bacterium]